MTYAEARALAKNGALIQRPHWCNPLRYRDNRLEFVKAVVVSTGAKPTRCYGSPRHEREATDWEVVG